jgi:hypothetical protein
MSTEDSVDVSIIPAEHGIRLISAEGAALEVLDPVIAWEIHLAYDDDDNPVSSVYPITINGTDYEAYGVQYADGSVSAFGAFYDSLEEAQADFPTADA